MAITGFLDIPEDVVPEILARLPVRSLLRFKCVCKSWLSLIKSPRFIANHLRYAPSIDDNAGVVLKHCNRDSRRGSVSFVSISNEGRGDISLGVPMSMPFFDDHDLDMSNVTFYGPCNGIICAFGNILPNQRYKKGDLISLWNPATREIKRLSVSNVPHRDDLQVFNVELGFGFDAKGNDYKVIKIIDFELRETRRLVRGSTLVEVYNLSTDCWRKIEEVVPTFMRIAYAKSTYLDGFYYWWSGDENGESMLSFDFADEVFEKIPPPDIEYLGTVTVLKYKEYVALAANDSGIPWITDCTALWVLNRDGDKSTWTKLFNVMFHSLWIKGFLWNGEALIVDEVHVDEHNYECHVVLYDPSSGQVQNLQAYDAVYDDINLQLVNYAESLVSFKPQGISPPRQGDATMELLAQNGHNLCPCIS